MEKHVIVIALLLLIAVFGLPAAANYAFDGFPLTTNSSGIVTGDVYVSVGDKDNATFYTTGLHTSNYTLPANIVTPVKWASVYVDVWGCNPTNFGWINVSFNGGPWQSRFYNGSNDDNPDTWGSAHGVIWARFDETSNVTSGANNVIVDGSVGDRIIRAVLVCAYNTSIPPGTSGDRSLVNYWINDGNYCLHYEHVGAGYATNSTTTWFNGTVGKVCDAKLATVYHASGGAYSGTAPEPDYLYFDVIPTLIDHGPYYHRPNQLGDDGNETYGDDDYADGVQFSLNTSDVTGLMNATGANSATFWRGHDDDDDGQIFHDSNWDNSTGAEGEAYLHPMLAVLVAENCTEKQRYARVDLIGRAAVDIDNTFSLPLKESVDVETALASISGNYTMVYWYNPLKGGIPGAWDFYMVGMPGISDFTELEPGKGYNIQPSANCTITWAS